MKEYTLASVLVFLLALGAAAVRGLWRDPSLWIGFLGFAVMTVVADCLLTGMGVYAYDRRFNGGIYVGKMPLEDLAYGLGLYLVAAVVWSWDGRRVD